jgi:hypothetical protein
MQSSKALLAAVGLVIISFSAGLFSSRLPEFTQKSSLVKSVQQAHPQLRFDACKSAPVAQDCIDGVLAAAATASVSASLCAEVKDEVFRTQCLGRVSTLSAMAGGMQAFCKGISDDPLCVELATVLNARLSQTRESCFNLQNETLRNFCLGLIPPAESVAVTPPATDTTKLPSRVYGLVCLPSEKDCADLLPIFRAAVAARSEEQCANTGIYKDLCLNEVALYRGYIENNISRCTARLPQAECQLQLTIARALDGQPNLCADLETEVHQQICINEVSAAAGQKRFDYLK